MKSNIKIVRHLLASGLALGAITTLHAGTFWWNTTTTGTWSTTTNWWTTDVGTTNPATPPVSGDSVVFNGTGVDGDAIVQLDADAASTGITFNNTGTTSIAPSDVTPRLLTIGSGGITMGSSAGNPSISSNIALSANQNWRVYGGKTLTLSGSVTGAFNLTKGGGTGQNGTWLFTTGANASVGAVDTSGSADLGLISVTGGSFSATSLVLRRSAAFDTAPTLAAPIAASTTTGLYVNGSPASASLGTLTVGFANSSASARVDNGSLTVSGAVALGRATSTRWNILQVGGGLFSAPDTTNGIVIAQNNGTTAGNAELYLSGGATTAGRIAFGAATDTVGGKGFVILGGGTLYLDTPGIVLANTTGLYTYTIGLNSGTLGAKESWSSSLNMTLGTNPTLKAADSSDVSKNIALNGNLTGGGFTKTGPGTLTLGGTATLTGTATGSVGTIYIPAGGSLSSNAIGGRGFWLDGGTLTTNNVTSVFAGGAANAYLQSAGTANVGTFATPNAGGELIKITGGGFTATSVSLNRTFSTNTVPSLGSPLAAPTTSGFYVNGDTAVANLGTLYIGTGNSNSSARIDDGSVTVSGAVVLGKKSAGSTRWDVLQINGGTFTAPDTSDGIVIGQNNGASANNAELYLSGGTTTAGRIAFGAATDTVGGNGLVIVVGANLYVGTGGIVLANTTGSYNYSVGLTSGTLGAADHWSSALNMTLGTNPTIKAADSLGVARNITLNGVLSGTAFSKTGAGILTLTAANTYTGGTTVNEGTLSLGDGTANTALPDGATVSIASPGTLNLNFLAANSDTVNKLFIGGVQKAAGIWGSATSGAPNVDPHFTGSGTLTVTTNPPGGFSTWITGTFANGNTVPGGQQGSYDDPDGDGVSNLEEYAVAGLDPTVPNGSIGTFVGNLFSVGKRQPLASDITYAIQESTDLGAGDPWQEVPTGGSYVNNGTTISYTLPGGPSKDFLRLKVEKP